MIINYCILGYVNRLILSLKYAKNNIRFYNKISDFKTIFFTIRELIFILVVCTVEKRIWLQWNCCFIQNILNTRMVLYPKVLLQHDCIVCQTHFTMYNTYAVRSRSEIIAIKLVIKPTFFFSFFFFITLYSQRLQLLLLSYNIYITKIRVLV